MSEKIVKKKFDELTSNELYQIIDLRLRVFLEEQKIMYVDTDHLDYDAIHYFYVHEERIVSYLRVIPKGDTRLSYTTIGRVVTDWCYRGNGLATLLIKEALYDFNEDVLVSGQAYLKEFYLKLGFKQISDEYLEEGIKHIKFLYKTN